MTGLAPGPPGPQRVWPTQDLHSDILACVLDVGSAWPCYFMEPLSLPAKSDLNIGSMGLLTCGSLSLCRILDSLSFARRVPTLHPCPTLFFPQVLWVLWTITTANHALSLFSKPALATPAQHAFPLGVKLYFFLKVLSKFLPLWKKSSFFALLLPLPAENERLACLFHSQAHAQIWAHPSYCGLVFLPSSWPLFILIVGLQSGP